MKAKENWQEIRVKILEGKELSEEEQLWVRKKIDDYWDNHPDVVNRYPRWKKYIAWVAGYQLMDYNKISKKLVEVPLKRKRRVVFNILKGFVRVLLAKLSAEPHTPGVIPATDDEADIEAARVGDRFISGHSDKIRFDQTTNQLKLWSIICNRAYLRVFWNADAHGLLGIAKNEIKDEMTGQTVGYNYEEIPDEGDLDIECVSPFNCRPDPLYSDYTKWRWFVYGEEVDASEIELNWGLKEGSLTEKSDTLDQAYDLELQDEQDIIVGTPEKKEDITGRTVVLKEFWTPDIYILVAGKKVLDYGSNPYEVIPYFDVEERLVPIDNYEKGFSFNESLIKDAIPIQREYNRQASIMSIALDRASKLKILVPTGSILNKQQWTNDYGVFIDFNPQKGNPYQMKLDPFPVEVPQYKQSLISEMQSVMNLHQASFGQLPERASHPSGSLVNLLLEQDDIVLNPLLNSINNAISSAWSLGLAIVQSNYINSRLIRYTGDEGTYSVMKFQGADLKGNTDVKVTTSSGLPKTRALRTEYILRLRESGLLTDDRLTLEMLEFGNAKKVFHDVLLHERKASRENCMITSDPNITPEALAKEFYPGDDDNAHLKIHERLRLSSKYYKFSPNQQKALDWMIQQHQQKAQQAQQAQIDQQIQMIVRQEVAKSQGLAALEQAKAAARIEIEKVKTKGDIVVEAVKQNGVQAQQELINKSKGTIEQENKLSPKKEPTQKTKEK